MSNEKPLVFYNGSEEEARNGGENDVPYFIVCKDAKSTDITQLVTLKKERSNAR